MFKKRNEPKRKDSGAKSTKQSKNRSTDKATELSDESLESIAGGVKIVPIGGKNNVVSLPSTEK